MGSANILITRTGVRRVRQNKFAFKMVRDVTEVQLKEKNRTNFTIQHVSLWSSSCGAEFSCDTSLNAAICSFHRAIVFLKWANPGLFFVYFRSFQTNNTIFTTNQCEKCPSCIRRWDSNPRPLERESPSITT